MVRILQTPTFKRAVKRLRKQQKQELDEAVRAVAKDPAIGEDKVGDLAGVRVHKFKMNRQLSLLAYEFLEADDAVKLLALGSHENFYRNLNR
ncbi:MAG: type II toxin-antitoxin system RelE/ParE family toxin [Proteobacteria bacterium]|nr:type II toxin-antitoxin system RelE/ParE family toxin [Pseudomonadota bacterium]